MIKRKQRATVGGQGQDISKDAPLLAPMSQVAILKKYTESLPNHEPVEAFHIQILSGVNNLKLSGDSTIHFITLYRMLVKL